MFILPPDLDEEAASSATERVRNSVTSRGGEIETLEFWGRRRLAYAIQHYHEGAYHVARFSLPPERAIELDRSLRLSEQVLRHLIVLVDE